MSAEVQSCDWPGASGKTYKYFVYPRHPSIKVGQDGNYIYAKIVNDEWVPVYIGQGDLSVRCTSNHHQAEAIDAKRATHVHMHKNAREADRLSEERDLLEAFPQAYAPTGCNVKKGG